MFLCRLAPFSGSVQPPWSRGGLHLSSGEVDHSLAVNLTTLVSGWLRRTLRQVDHGLAVNFATLVLGWLHLTLRKVDRETPVNSVTPEEWPIPTWWLDHFVVIAYNPQCIDYLLNTGLIGFTSCHTLSFTLGARGHLPSGYIVSSL